MFQAYSYDFLGKYHIAKNLELCDSVSTTR